MSNITNKLRLVGYDALATKFDVLEKAWVNVSEIWNLIVYYGGPDRIKEGSNGEIYLNTIVRHAIFKNAPSKLHALIQMNIADSLLEKMNTSIYALFRFKACIADYLTDNMYIQDSEKGKLYTNIKQCIENNGIGKLVIKQNKDGLYFYDKDKGIINKIDLPEGSKHIIRVGVDSTRELADNDGYKLELDKYIIRFKIYTSGNKGYELYHSSKYAFDIEDNDEEKEIANALKSLIDLTLKTNMKIHDAITEAIGEDLDKTVNNIRRILDEQ